MPNFWDKYQGERDKLAGNISDITRFGNYQEALDDLQKLRDDEQQLRRVGDLRRKLKSVDKNVLPRFREEDTPELNPDYFEMLQGTSPENLPPEISNYDNYAKFIEEQKDPNKTVKTFDEYLTTMGVKDAFMQGNPGAYRTGKKQVPLTQEEIDQEYYKQAGLSPEDVQFFNEYKDKNIGTHNKALEQFMLEHGPSLRSSGSMGNTYEEDLKKQLSSMMLEEPAPTKYEIKIDEKSGNIIYFNPQDPNDRQVVKYANPEKKPEKNTISKYQQMTLEEAMNLPEGEIEDAIFYFSEDVRNALKSQFPVLQNIEDKAFKTGIYQSKTGSSRRYRGGSSKSIDFGKWNPEKFKELTPDELAKFTAGELKALGNYSNYLSSDVQSALDSLLDGGTYQSPGSDNNDGAIDEVGDVMNEYTKDANDEQKEAVNNVNKWFEATMKAWGRNDLTADQWREEALQEPWSDIEFGIVQDLFMRKFGEQL